MTTKITIIYDNPTVVDAFERGFSDTKQLELARALPGLERLESSIVWPKEDGTPAPAHRLIDLYFADYDSASAAVATEAAGRLFPSIFGIATGECGSSSPRSKRAERDGAGLPSGDPTGRAATD